MKETKKKRTHFNEINDNELLKKAMAKDSDKLRGPLSVNKDEYKGLWNMQSTGFNVIKGNTKFDVSSVKSPDSKRTACDVEKYVMDMEKRMKSKMYKYIFDNLYRFGRARVITGDVMVTYSIKDMKGFAITKFKRLYELYNENKIDSKEPLFFQTLKSINGLSITTEPVPADMLTVAKKNRVVTIDNDTTCMYVTDTVVHRSDMVKTYNLIMYDYYEKYKETFANNKAEKLRDFIKNNIVDGDDSDVYKNSLGLMMFMFLHPDIFYENPETEWLVNKSKNILQSEDAKYIEFYIAFYTVICSGLYGVDTFIPDKAVKMADIQPKVEELYKKVTESNIEYMSENKIKYRRIFKCAEFCDFILFLNNKKRGLDIKYKLI